MCKAIINCDWCGGEFIKYKSKISKHNFCCRDCMNSYASKSKNPKGYARLKDYTNISRHMADMNREMNPNRMTTETREKLRSAHLDSGAGRSYRKQFGKHEHRIIAAEMLGRELRPGEVVHHIDEDKRNNSPENLKVFSSQAEHAGYHKKLEQFFASAGGDD